MPRSGPGVYSKPAGTTPANGDLTDAPTFNTLLDDIAADLNTPRPIVAGGTGASTAGAALTALGGTATGTSIFTAANAAAVRTAIALVPQATAIDTTAGRLLTVGGFGLGLTGASTVIADIDSATIPAGSVQYDATTVGTFPTGVTAANGGVFDFARITANAGRETLMPSNQNALFFSRLVGAVVQPWYSIVSVLASTLADGDTIARIGGIWARVAKGAAGQVYRQNDALTAPIWSDPIAMTAAQSTATGTVFDFNSIPAWVNRITVKGASVSLSGTDLPIVQLGTSVAFIAAGYVSSIATISGATTNSAASTTGFAAGWNVAAESQSFQMVLTRLTTGSNIWVEGINGVRTVSGALTTGAGTIDLGAQLTRVRVTRSGTDTFDAGSVSISYE